MLTTTNMTAVSVSTRNAHSTSKPPDWIQRSTETLISSCSPIATSKKTYHDNAAAMIISPLVTYSEALAPIERAEKAGDQKADQRQEDDSLDDGIHSPISPSSC